MRILLDLDEVLADFVGGCCNAWGLRKADVLTHWEIGKWDMVPPLAKALNTPLTENDFWGKINDNSDFWSNLSQTPWAMKIVQLAESFTEEVYVVSAPSHCISSHVGKIYWLKGFFGNRFDRFILTPHKYLFAKADTILIDDNEKGVTKFVESGGQGIVFPAYHNSMYRYRDEPISWVKEQLAILFGDQTNAR